MFRNFIYQSTYTVVKSYRFMHSLCIHALWAYKMAACNYSASHKSMAMFAMVK